MGGSNEKMPDNYAALARGTGDHKAEVNVHGGNVEIAAGDGTPAAGVKNVAVGADGNAKIDVQGKDIKIRAGVRDDDANTIKWKAELFEILQGVPEHVVNELLRELKNDFGVYLMKDLKQLTDEDMQKIKSVTGVAKQKLIAYVKKMP